MICLMAMHYQNAKSCLQQILPQSPADHAISWDRASQVADSTTGEKMSPHRQDSEPIASANEAPRCQHVRLSGARCGCARAARKAFLPASPGYCRDRGIGSHAGPQRRGHRPAACSLAGDARSARPGARLQGLPPHAPRPRDQPRQSEELRGRAPRSRTLFQHPTCGKGKQRRTAKRGDKHESGSTNSYGLKIFPASPLISWAPRRDMPQVCDSTQEHPRG